MSADRWYGKGGQGLTKTKMQTGEVIMNKPKKRLKIEVAKDIESLLDTKIPGLDKATMIVLTTLETAIQEKYNAT